MRRLLSGGLRHTGFEFDDFGLVIPQFVEAGVLHNSLVRLQSAFKPAGLFRRRGLAFAHGLPHGLPAPTP